PSTIGRVARSDGILVADGCQRGERRAPARGGAGTRAACRGALRADRVRPLSPAAVPQQLSVARRWWLQARGPRARLGPRLRPGRAVGRAGTGWDGPADG